jgi:hypothetical protein
MDVSRLGFIRIAWNIYGRRDHTQWYDDTEDNKDYLYTILDDGEYRYPGTHRMEFDDGARSRRLTEALFRRLRIQVAEPR